jgi:hypothetical protein
VHCTYASENPPCLCALQVVHVANNDTQTTGRARGTMTQERTAFSNPTCLCEAVKARSVDSDLDVNACKHVRTMEHCWESQEIRECADQALTHSQVRRGVRDPDELVLIAFQGKSHSCTLLVNRTHVRALLGRRHASRRDGRLQLDPCSIKLCGCSCRCL